MLPPISELERLDYLEDLGGEYERITGTPPFELSHWDPSDETIDLLTQYLSLPPPPLAAPYIYPYYVGVREEILAKLGLIDQKRRCLFSPAGTSALNLALCWLKSLNVERLLVLCPTYFPIFYAAAMLGIPFTKVNLERKSNGVWCLPQGLIDYYLTHDSSRTAIWITNPVYSTGVYYQQDDVKFLDSLLTRGNQIVVDECLAINGMELSRKLSSSDGLLGIYSPHKSICVNAIKFAAIVYNKNFDLFFNHWTDVVSGGLGASNHSAIFHFLDENFAKYQRKFFHHIDAVRKQVESTISEQFAMVHIDQNVLGHFMMLYLPHLPGVLGNDKNFLRDLVWASGAIMIPGIRNHFDSELGFCFRVNLARKNPQFFGALFRVCKYLSDSV